MMHFILMLFVIANSVQNCKYFGSDTGPLFPIDVCNRWHAPPINYTRSYIYQCSDNTIILRYFPWSDECEPESKDQGIMYPLKKPTIILCSGDICDYDHMAFATQYQSKQNECSKDESLPWYQYSFVKNCWNSSIASDRSWSLKCSNSGDSLNLGINYKNNHCQDSPNNVTYIRNECAGNDLFDTTYYFNFFYGSNNSKYWHVYCSKSNSNNSKTNYMIIVLIGIGVCIVCSGCVCCCKPIICPDGYQSFKKSAIENAERAEREKIINAAYTSYDYKREKREAKKQAEKEREEREHRQWLKENNPMY